MVISTLLNEFKASNYFLYLKHSKTEMEWSVLEDIFHEVEYQGKKGNELQESINLITVKVESRQHSTYTVHK